MKRVIAIAVVSVLFAPPILAQSVPMGEWQGSPVVLWPTMEEGMPSTLPEEWNPPPGFKVLGGQNHAIIPDAINAGLGIIGFFGGSESVKDGWMMMGTCIYADESYSQGAT